MSNVLVIAPVFDLPTSISSQAVSSLLKFLIDRQVKHAVLVGAESNRAFFEITTRLRQYDAVFYYGHGNETSLLGTHFLLTMANLLNAGRFKNAIVYTMACLSGVRLGPAAIEQGARAYFGHETYYYAAFPEPEHNYMADWIEYVTEIPRALVNGKTCGEAFNLYKSKCTMFLQKYRTSGFENGDWYASTLQKNRDYSRLVGDRNARLV